MTARVIVVGDIVTDVVVLQHHPLAAGSDTPADIRLVAGGSAANTAAWLAPDGPGVAICGVVGDDEAGAARVAELVTLGVGCAAVRRVPGTATGSVVVLVADGERTMLCDRGANALLSPADIDAALTANPEAAHLHLSGYVFFDARSAPAGRHALAAARARGLTTSVDAASAAPLRRLGASVFAEWVAGVDILLANLDEALVLATRGAPGAPTAQGAPDAVVAALADLAEHVVVKRGAEGAVWADATGTYRVAAQRVDVAVDPTGAGDAFAAGLLAAWLTGADPAEALTAGAERGARAVQILGGRPGIDGRPSIDGRGVGPARPRHDHPSQDQRNLSHIAASESIHHRKM